jgi:uncharacterized protein (UPF0333 family)
LGTPVSRSSRKARLLLYCVIVALIVAIAYSLQSQGSSSLQGKEVEAGLIESGGTPALYFNLRNLGQETSNYTYTVSYNSTDRGQVTEGSTVTVPGGKTFSYTLSLVRPPYGVIIVDLEIYGGNEAVYADIRYNQSWTIRAQS